MSTSIQIISPIDGSIVAERALATDTDINAALNQSSIIQQIWKKTRISERARLCHKAIDILRDNTDALALEITHLMGRPVSHSPAEIKGMEERARYMINIAEAALQDKKIDASSDDTANEFTRFIRREPLGLVLVLAPWNYPYLTAVNSIIPALMAGNTVILKHSQQTLLCAERFYDAFVEAGLPDGVFQFLHINHQATSTLIKNPLIDFVSFTGSVRGGIAIEESAAGLFKGVALELGGKDSAYVMPDAHLENSVASLVDGAFFNCGQSCCGIERIYVHQDVYNPFVELYVEKVKQLRLDNPLNADTTLGPMVNISTADYVREQINSARTQGATLCINDDIFNTELFAKNYLAPQVLLNVNHEMDVMTKESFGPVVGIMNVSNDAQAIDLINDSEFGLTASLWTPDETKATKLGGGINTGTVFMNRCDYLDPALAWVGVKNSGRGCSLSSLGFDQLTRPKSFHMKK